MKLKKEIEYYLRQLVFGLAIDSNPNCFKTEKQEIPILLNDFKLFNEKITQIGIEYPLIHDSKIWEFKQLAKHENVSSEEVLQIIDILMAEWLPNYDIDFRSIKTFTQRDPMVLGILLLDIQTEALKDMLRFMAVPGITESELEEAVKQAVYEHSLHLHEKRITIIENLRKAFTPQQEDSAPIKKLTTNKRSKEFYDYITGNEDVLKPILNKKICGSGPVDIIITIRALESIDLITIPNNKKELWKSIRKEFGVGFEDEAYYKQMREPSLLNDRIEILGDYIKKELLNTTL